MGPARVESPCIRRCTLDEDDICVGCHRSMAEIMAWQGMTDEERTQALARAAERRAEHAARRRAARAGEKENREE